MDYGCIFITGLSASGKSTLSELLHKNLRDKFKLPAQLVDGEMVREELRLAGRPLGFEAHDRELAALEIARYARRARVANLLPIVASICPKKSVREEMKNIMGKVFEVHLSCPVDVCADRDYKGNYAKARLGLIKNMVGVNEPYEPSDNLDLALETGIYSAEVCLEQLLIALERNKFLSLKAPNQESHAW